MKKEKQHVITKVLAESIAEEMGIEPGDKVLKINEKEIEDVFDYQFLIQDNYIELLIEKQDKEQWLLEIDKEYDEDLGIEFDDGLMDDYKRCSNNCIFCFIDQMPSGMRETLYFKDDDTRLSFLQGNYVTLTNLSEGDIQRIIEYRLSPINISIQTMNPELRCMMLQNRFAGESLKKLDFLHDAGITMNGQIVLCKGINDGKELEFSIQELSRYIPNLESVSVVPVGISKYREGLYPLEAFSQEDAKSVLHTIHTWQDKMYKQYGIHFIHASDEWYILAGEELPKEESYDEYLQLENGVGMLRLLMEEFNAARATLNTKNKKQIKEEISMATGVLAYPYINKMAQQLMEDMPNLKINVYQITNHFFGEQITVSGLLTGQDFKEQLMGKKLGQRLLLPQNVLRSGEAVFLDDITLEELEKTLQVSINIVKSSGYDFVNAVLGTVQ